MSSTRASTPPHHPTHGVNLSSDSIREIVFLAYPEGRNVNIQQLPSGKSFNNRIYFVSLTVKSMSTTRGVTPNMRDSPEPLSLVLKVSGQFFGPHKVQNEVSCLFLLEKHCPSIPVPRVDAWSEDGITARNLSRYSKFQVQDSLSVRESPCPKNVDCTGRGWILMSRRPGRLICKKDLTGSHGMHLMRELAGSVANWRQILPTADRIGNIKIGEILDSAKADDLYDELSSGFAKLAIDGLLLCHYVPPGPIRTSIDYYRIKVEDQLTKLEIEEVFAARRSEVSPLVRNFLKSSMPKLSLFSDESLADIRFTHYDFSPRNILVSDTSPPTISGILDFEFAGFFPIEEEFTNNAIANSNDWPEQAYEEFLKELEKRGVETPLRGISKTPWKEACKLVEVTGDIAPWYLREGDTKGQELEEELSKAAERVKQGLAELEAGFRKP